MKRIPSFFLCIIFCLFSCGEPDFNIPEYTPIIAVDGIIEAGRVPIVYLTYSSGFIADYDSLDFVDMIKFNVSAYVITEVGDTVGMTRRTNSDHFPPFYYTTSVGDLIGESGKHYDLLIRKAGMEDIRASTLIPEDKPMLIDSEFNSTSEDLSSGYYSLILESTDLNFYFVRNAWNRSTFYPLKIPVLSNRLLLSSDTMRIDMVKGVTSNIWLSYEHLVISDSIIEDDSSPEIDYSLFHENDTVLVKMSMISEESFNVLSSLFIDVAFPDNPFRPLSQLPISNVSNGIGHWTGMNTLTYRLNPEYFE